MSIFADFLYKLTPRDEQVTPLEMITFSSGSTASAGRTVYTAAATNYTVPSGRILILTSFAVNAYNNAGVVDQLNGYVDVNGGAAYYCNFFARQLASAAAGSVYGGAASLEGSRLYVPPGREISASAGFSISNASNSVSFTLSGILIPRGNIAL